MKKIVALLLCLALTAGLLMGTLSVQAAVYYAGPDSVMLYDGESLNPASDTIWGTVHTLETGKVGNALKMQSTNAGNASTAYVGAATFVDLGQTVDLTNYTTLSVDVYIPTKMTGNQQFELNCVNRSIDIHDGKDVRFSVGGLEPGWYTFTATKDQFGDVHGGTVLWSEISGMRIAWFNLDAVDETTYFLVDNVMFTNGESTYHQIKLDANGGSTENPVVLAADGYEITLPTPTRDGYRFLGWNTDANATSGVTKVTATGDATYYAIWQIKMDCPYVVDDETMMLYDGEDLDCLEVRYGEVWEDMTISLAPGKTGNALKMYSPSGTIYGAGSVVTMTYMKMSKSIDLSTYDQITYDVYLDKKLDGHHIFQVNFIDYSVQQWDGYNWNIDFDDFESGWYTFTIDLDEISHPVEGTSWNNINGLRFAWFNYTESEIAENYFLIDNVKAVRQGVILDKIQLDVNGGNALLKTEVSAATGETVTLPTPSRDGYIFMGWNTDQNATDGVTTITANGDATYYAIWKANPAPGVYPYVINENSMMLYDGDTTQGLTTAYYAQASVGEDQEKGTVLLMECQNPASESAGNKMGGMVFSQQNAADVSGYKKITFDLYVPRDFTNESAAFQVNFCTTGEDGYSYLFALDNLKAGWYTIDVNKVTIAKTSDTADWSNINSIRFAFLNYDGNATPTTFKIDNLKAYNTPKATYTVHLDVNGGDAVTETDITVQDGNEVTLPTVTREGYTFVGWNTDKDATEGVTTVKVTEDVTYYAIWKENEVTPPPTPEEPTGDLNGDGTTDAKDALAALKHAVGKDVLSDELVKVGDLNKDGVLDAKDALAMLKIAVGK